MNVRALMVTAVIGLLPGVALAKVDGNVQSELRARLEGKLVVARVDVKQIKILKQVRGDRMAGVSGVENMEQTKDATIVTPAGVRYADEAHARPWLYAPRGSALQIESVDFKGSSIEIEVKAPALRESTVITFEFDRKLDPSFSERPAFETMLVAVFEGRLQ